MKTSVIESPGKIVIKETSLPRIGDDEVLVKLQGTGVCASNLPVWEGREWFKYPFEPGAPGHEGYGIIAGKGENINHLSVGDKVSFLSYNAYAEYDKAPAGNVVKMPLSLDNTPFPGEPVACAVNVFRRSDIRKEQVVMVIGAGFLGCLLVRLIKNAGARAVVVSRRKTSLEYARAAGADQLIPFDDYYEAVHKIKSIFPEGIPRIIEATGMQSSIDLATEIIAIRGRLIIAGYHQDGLRNINMQSWNWKGIDVINAHERDPQAYIDGLKEAIMLAEQKILEPEKYVTHYISLDNISEAFRLLKERPETFLKAVITY